MRTRQENRRDGRLIRTLAIAGAALLVAAAFAAAAVGAVPAKFWGVDPQSLPTEEEFQRLQRGGVDSLRLPIEWNSVESQQGQPNWDYVDSMIKGTASSGIEALPFVTGAPEWAVKSAVVAGGALAPKTLPVKSGAQRAAWQQFLSAAVARYGPNGVFWSEHPGVPYIPVRTWQIWNEENFEYFAAKPNPAEYGQLVKLSSATVKGVDPGAKIILGGMFSFPKGCRIGKHPRNICAPSFLEQMYRKTPGIKTAFNGVALHPYTGNFKLLTPYIEDFRAVLKRNHDAGKGLWITELGWSSSPPDPKHDVFAKGVNGQTAQLKGAFNLFERNLKKWHLQRVFWFSVDDRLGNCNFCDGSGLFDEHFNPKPSWKAYVKFAGGTP